MNDKLAKSQPPVRWPSGLGSRLLTFGRMAGIEYPWEATRVPDRAVGPVRHCDDEESEVLDDEPRDLVDIFGAP